MVYSGQVLKENRKTTQLSYITTWYPREESNLYHLLRTELLYPLSYGGLIHTYTILAFVR